VRAKNPGTGSVIVKRNNKKGQGLVEYALLLALVALAVMSTLMLLSGTLQTNYIDRIPAALDAAMPAP
jgi:Flp pilus assembly pilin Flp